MLYASSSPAVDHARNSLPGTSFPSPEPSSITSWRSPFCFFLSFFSFLFSYSLLTIGKEGPPNDLTCACPLYPTRALRHGLLTFIISPLPSPLDTSPLPTSLYFKILTSHILSPFHLYFSSLYFVYVIIYYIIFLLSI